MPRRLLCALLLTLVAGVGSLHAGSNAWTPIGPDGGAITTLAVSPAQPGLLYAGSAFAGLYRSTDGGATWVWVSRGLDDSVIAVAVDPQHASTVYVVSRAYDLMKSVDAGQTWTALDVGDGVESLAIDPSSPSTLYAGTFHGIWKSTNAGRSWTRLRKTSPVAAVAVDPSRPSRVYAVEHTERALLLRSTDSGRTWSEQDAAFSITDEVEIALDPSSAPATVYVSMGYLIGTGFTFRSTDAGESWQRADRAGFPVAVGAGVVYAGAVMSTDGGATWTQRSAAPGTATVLAAAPGSAATVYAATSQGVWKSGDAAASWQAASRGLNATQTLALAIDPLHPRILYASVAAAAQGLAMLRSGNGGRTWRALTQPPSFVPGEQREELVIDPQDPTVLYAGSRLGLARSADGGKSWVSLDREIRTANDSCQGVKQLAIDPLHPGTFYAAATDYSGVPCTGLKSTDFGASWSDLGLPLDQIAVAPSDPATLYAGEGFFSEAVFKSTDAGSTWNRLRVPAGSIMELVIDPTDANRAFLLQQRAVYRTADGGLTWIESDRKLPVATLPAASLAIDPHFPDLLYAIGRFGAYHSVNGGRSWFPIAAGLPRFVLDSFGYYGVQLVLDPKQPGKLYVGTYSGIYTYTIE